VKVFWQINLRSVHGLALQGDVRNYTSESARRAIALANESTESILLKVNF
jgi:hypothetical protein